MSETNLEGRLKDLPNLHVRVDADGKPFATSGGFDLKHLEWISNLLDSHISAFPSASSIETGAGLSTILFLMKGFSKVTSIAPDLFLERGIRSYCGKRGINTDALDYRLSRSEFELPRLAEGGSRVYDVALLDGDHGWPNVFVDFCYMNFMLRTGGLMIFDDSTLYPVAECVNFLAEEPGWQLISRWSKLTVFKRVTNERFTAGAGRRYLTRKSEELANRPPKQA